MSVKELLEALGVVIGLGVIGFIAVWVGIKGWSSLFKEFKEDWRDDEQKKGG
jgi:hypothetical protein